MTQVKAAKAKDDAKKVPGKANQTPTSATTKVGADSTDGQDSEDSEAENPKTETTKPEETKAKQKPATKADDKQPDTKDAKRKAAKKVADEQGVKTLFENSKGEYFTQLPYAISSEGGKKENVITHKF